VRDIQDRLQALSHETTPDAPGEFGKATFDAVSAFQVARGLASDGIVGPDTWRSLWEASYRLGDRLLFHRRPMQRGDDVSELQGRLNSLGFDAGNVDGILGPDTRGAVTEFQHNRSMAEDGIAGPSTIAELRVVARVVPETGREAVRERQWLRSLPDSLVGARIFLDPGCRDDREDEKAWAAASAAAGAVLELGGIPVLSRTYDTRLPVRIRSGRANRLGAVLVISFQLAAAEAPSIAYFESAHSRSEAGHTISGALASRLGLPPLGVASPILKETRAPAVLIISDDLSPLLGAQVIGALAEFFAAGE
jgi:N-acetylmuramoyl-L-alanine amidase